MTDAEALLRAITANPDEDTPRLMYADALEERGESARAEFIRVQCRAAGLERDGHGDNCPALARMVERAKTAAGGQMYPKCVRCEDLQHLQFQAGELLAEHEARWRAAPCVRCRGKGFRMEREPHQYGDRYKVKCEACLDGDAGGLMEKFDSQDDRYMGGAANWVVACTYDRGFIRRVTVPTLADLVERVHGNAHGEMDSVRHRPTDWARAVLTATPERGAVQELVCLDREPATVKNGFVWRADRGREELLEVVPVELDLPWVYVSPSGNYRRTSSYPSYQEAVSALGRAIAAFALNPSPLT